MPLNWLRAELFSEEQKWKTIILMSWLILSGEVGFFAEPIFHGEFNVHADERPKYNIIGSPSVALVI